MSACRATSPFGLPHEQLQEMARVGEDVGVGVVECGRKVKRSNPDIAVRQQASPLRELTCRIESHSATCQRAQTEVTLAVFTR